MKEVILYFYLGISVVNIIMTFMAGKVAAHEFKKRYPYIELNSSTTITRVFSTFRLILICFIPLINIALLGMYLFNFEKLQEKTIKRMYSEYSKEVTDDGRN